MRAVDTYLDEFWIIIMIYQPCSECNLSSNVVYIASVLFVNVMDEVFKYFITVIFSDLSSDF